MPQRDPDRAVADVTGETTSAVRRRGLVVIDPRHDSLAEPDDVPPQYLDWERMLETRPVHPAPRRVEADPCVAPF